MCTKHPLILDFIGRLRHARDAKPQSGSAGAGATAGASGEAGRASGCGLIGGAGQGGPRGRLLAAQHHLVPPLQLPSPLAAEPGAGDRLGSGRAGVSWARLLAPWPRVS